ncbi:hypothetical protein SM0020_29045 [Sinorhizobium meliloti CCNWSX0020]|uniref:Uncharacterized protein n=1 Tax=Sinorhizobium meliloti CCNWSX0020 TaxID=1107881 RepID=H0G8H0_RHIML|nr:hypothetical protein SM0020_29045 [Sinorhizobium meliloti CCNWSX0020]
MIATDVSALVQARRASDVYCALQPIGLPGPIQLLRKTAVGHLPAAPFSG